MSLDNQPTQQGEVGPELHGEVGVCIFSPSPLFH
jgi:hypothetical protein